MFTFSSQTPTVLLHSSLSDSRQRAKSTPFDKKQAQGLYIPTTLPRQLSFPDNMLRSAPIMPASAASSPSQQQQTPVQNNHQPHPPPPSTIPKTFSHKRKSNGTPFLSQGLSPFHGDHQIYPASSPIFSEDGSMIATDESNQIALMRPPLAHRSPMVTGRPKWSPVVHTIAVCSFFFCQACQKFYLDDRALENRLSCFFPSPRRSPF